MVQGVTRNHDQGESKIVLAVCVVTATGWARRIRTAAPAGGAACIFESARASKGRRNTPFSAARRIQGGNAISPWPKKGRSQLAPPVIDSVFRLGNNARPDPTRPG
jgi:hypothetical protein